MKEVRLGIDTTTKFLVVALWTPTQGTLAHVCDDVGRGHAQRWIDAVDRVFADAAVDRESLTAVAVGVGPGSYTGTRIGIAAARGLAFASQVPLSGACSLSAAAWAVLAPGEAGVVAIDARRGAVYSATFERRDDDLHVLDWPAKRAREEVRSTWSGTRWIEDVPPDSGWIAARPPGARPATPVYM